MEKLRFYDVLRPMECLAGDTLPVFAVAVDLEDLTGCTMQVIISEEKRPAAAALTKSCTAAVFDSGEAGFSVRLTGTDTAGLLGTYTLVFDMADASGTHYKKLAGTLTVLPCAGGAAT